MELEVRADSDGQAAIFESACSSTGVCYSKYMHNPILGRYTYYLTGNPDQICKFFAYVTKYTPRREPLDAKFNEFIKEVVYGNPDCRKV